MSKLEAYYPSKSFCDSWEIFSIPKNIRTRYKQRIYAVDMHANDYFMTYNMVIPSVDNALKNVYLSTTLLNEFSST